jgi:hypothetical protein
MMDLPLFPLHTVLCPGIALPLHIFEPRYRAMVRHCLQTDEPFGVVWIREGREVGSGELSVAAVGTVAQIREADRRVDGRYDLIAVGTGRFRIEEVFTDRAPYLVARAEPMADLITDERRALRLARTVTRRFVRYVDEVRDLAETDDGRAVAPAGPRPEGGPAPARPSVDEGSPALGWDRREEADPAREGIPADADQGTLDDVPVSTDGARGIPPSVDQPAGDAAPWSGDEHGRDGPLAIPGDPTLLSHLIAGIVELDLPRRQALLERETTEERLADLAAILSREVEYLARGLRVYVPDPREGASRRN